MIQLEGFDLLISAILGLVFTTFGPMVKQAYEDYKQRQIDPTYKRPQIPASPKAKRAKTKASKLFWVKTTMQIIVSAVILYASIHIIMLPGIDAKDKQWAYASAGTILGFWLKH
jgi:hypothetical protein